MAKKRSKGFINRSKNDVVITYNTCLVILGVGAVLAVAVWFLFFR